MWVAQQIIELTLCHFIKCSNGGWGNIKDAFRMGAPTLAPERSEWNVASTLVLLTWLHRCYQSAPPRLAQWVKIFDSFKIPKKHLFFAILIMTKKKSIFASTTYSNNGKKKDNFWTLFSMFQITVPWIIQELLLLHLMMMVRITNAITQNWWLI